MALDKTLIDQKGNYVNKSPNFNVTYAHAHSSLESMMIQTKYSYPTRLLKVTLVIC
ncbi:hypothetical protein FORC53_4074 [Vibrio vulnificus]|uniref:Uncharacterized protein n=1 Tax=Vibrio vulnificus TaxID=672 RepID=A0AAN1PTE8_VIBVL|nr:hypothetical protein FORC53_4074 [Vibrio vulnificus]